LRLADDTKRQERNCDCESNDGFFLEWAPEHRRCPNATITPEVNHVIQWWSEWREYKVLPFPGEMRDQPAYVFEAIRACSEEARKIEQEKSKE